MFYAFNVAQVGSMMHSPLLTINGMAGRNRISFWYNRNDTDLTDELAAWCNIPVRDPSVILYRREREGVEEEDVEDFLVLVVDVSDDVEDESGRWWGRDVSDDGELAWPGTLVSWLLLEFELDLVVVVAREKVEDSGGNT